MNSIFSQVMTSQPDHHFPLNRPTGPIQSVCCDVCLLCVVVPLHTFFLQKVLFSRPVSLRMVATIPVHLLSPPRHPLAIFHSFSPFFCSLPFFANLAFSPFFTVFHHFFNTFFSQIFTVFSLQVFTYFQPFSQFSIVLYWCYYPQMPIGSVPPVF